MVLDSICKISTQLCSTVVMGAYLRPMLQLCTCRPKHVSTCEHSTIFIESNSSCNHPTEFAPPQTNQGTVDTPWDVGKLCSSLLLSLLRVNVFIQTPSFVLLKVRVIGKTFLLTLIVMFNLKWQPTLKDLPFFVRFGPHGVRPGSKFGQWSAIAQCCENLREASEPALAHLCLKHQDTRWWGKYAQSHCGVVLYCTALQCILRYVLFRVLANAMSESFVEQCKHWTFLWSDCWLRKLINSTIKWPQSM